MRLEGAITSLSFANAQLAFLSIKVSGERFLNGAEPAGAVVEVLSQIDVLKVHLHYRAELDRKVFFFQTEFNENLCTFRTLSKKMT